jgi:hypothetical protein
MRLVQHSLPLKLILKVVPLETAQENNKQLSKLRRTSISDKKYSMRSREPSQVSMMNLDVNKKLLRTRLPNNKEMQYSTVSRMTLNSSRVSRPQLRIELPNSRLM